MGKGPPLLTIHTFSTSSFPDCSTMAPAMREASTCETCGKRMGFIGGLRGFGLRERMHPRRCLARAQREADRAGNVKSDAAEVLFDETSAQPFQLKPSVGTWMLKPCHPFSEEGSQEPQKEPAHTASSESSQKADPVVETTEAANATIETEKELLPAASAAEAATVLVESQDESLPTVSAAQDVPVVVEQSEPAKPMEKAEPAEAAEPAKPVENAEPVETSEPAKPVENAEPAETSVPVKPVGNTEPAEKGSSKGRKSKGKGKGKGKGKDRKQK